MSRFLASLLCSCALYAGCAGPWYAYDFAPAPQEARVVDEGIAGSQARTLLSLLGILRPAEGAPARVQARLSVENLGLKDVRLVPESFELATSDLATFRASSVAPADQLVLLPGEKRVFEVAFDLPEGREPRHFGFDGVALKFGIDLGRGAPVETSVSFQRVPPYSSEPRMRASFGVGYMWS